MRLIVNKHFIFYLSIIVFISCSTNEQNIFSISGKIEPGSSEFVLLKKSENLQKKTTRIIDTLFVNPQGSFSASYTEEPHIYFLSIRGETIPLAIDNNQHIKISGSVENGFDVQGSEDTNLLNNYEQFRKKSLQKWVGSVRDQIKILRGIDNSENDIIELRKKEVENYEIHLDELMSFVEENMGTSIAIYATSLRWRNFEKLDFLKNLVAEFKKEHPNTELNSLLQKRIELIEKTSIGGTITNIELANVDKEITSLDANKGKYTLIDFWASWCGPCRAESGLLNEIYADYGKNGFEIYGVSLDSNEERWIQAIAKDQRQWVNVASFKGLRSDVALEYGVNALPTNFIIDEKGEIIAKNVHGEQLDKIVSALFN